MKKVYLLLYVLMIIASIIRATTISFEYPLFILLSILVICMNLFISLLTHVNTKMLIIYVFLIILIIIKYIFKLNIISIELVTLYSFIVNIQLLNIKLFLRYDLGIKFLLILLIITLNYIKLIPSVNIGDRYSLGFGNPDSLATFALGCIFSFILYFNIKKERLLIEIIIIGICLLITIIFNDITRDRSLLLCGSFICLLILLNISTIRQILFKGIIPLELLICIFSIIIVYKYDPSNYIFNRVNDLLSDRLGIQSLMIEWHPLKLVNLNGVGSIINKEIKYYYGLTAANIDNMYFGYAYYNGIIGLIIMEYIYIRVSFIAERFKEYIPSVLLLTLAIYSITASNLISLFMDIPILYSLAFAYKGNK